MKKAGLVTFFDHPNYGAALQAYGLKYALESMGCSVVFIRNTGCPAGADGETNRRRRVLEALRRGREALRPAGGAFAAFAEKHFRTEPAAGPGGACADCDFFIAGSDQVWNAEITGRDPFWFLDFAPPEKRFSYAASFGADSLPEGGMPWYREMLAPFAGLSVREASGRKIIMNLTGREAAVCPDPVLLPGRGVWEELMVPAEPAVVLYMTEYDPALRRCAAEDAAARGLPLAVLSPGGTPSADGAHVPSPEAWLGSVANAAAVYTNSFHALVFSHIFHRDLRFSLLTRLKNRNGRLLSFLDSMGETPAEEESRPGLFRPEGSGGREDTDIRLDALRRSGLGCLRKIVQASGDRE